MKVCVCVVFFKLHIHFIWLEPGRFVGFTLMQSSPHYPLVPENWPGKFTKMWEQLGNRLMQKGEKAVGECTRVFK